MFVIGTAGHVDHGKSTLIRALSGIDPDRLPEEQRRGMTIELGFAWMTLPSGREVSIVDVPGHIRFVRHMLAGIGAVDLALLVIAADEGVMPQTREHLAILDLLDVTRAVVALTKIDLVEADWLDLVEADVRALIDETSLAGAPIHRVSAATGDGLNALRAMLDRMLDETPPARDIGRPRLGVDRVFTMPGFGTVVTGTLLDGTLHTGDTVEIVPGGRTARVRGLQTHRQEVAAAHPGTRVAVNLTGVSTDEVRRGDVVARPGTVTAARQFDARLRALPGETIRHNLRGTIHLGSAEAAGRVRVLGDDATEDGTIEDGASGWVQIVLGEPLAATAGDLFVLRVSDRTLGGGRVVEVNPPRHRRTDPALPARLEARAAGTPESRLIAALERAEPCTLAALVQAVDLDPAEANRVVQALLADGLVRQLTTGAGDPLLMLAASVERAATAVRAILDRYHAARPLRHAMPREELRSALGMPQREFTAMIGGLAPEIVVRGDGVVEHDWEPRPTPALAAAIAAVERDLAGGLQAGRAGAADPEVLAYLVEAGRVVDCGDGVLLDAAAWQDAVARVTTVARDNGSVTLAQARDTLGTGRRQAQAILETMDRLNVTVRQGDVRVLRGGNR